MLIGVAALAALLAGGISHARAGSEGAPLRVLFVGNSLTTTNDLPAQVAELAAASGRKLTVGTVAYDGYSLEDHWNRGDARAALAKGGWDVVIMQQGPSSLPESQAHLRRWAGRFAGEARTAHTRPALLTVWPEAYRKQAFGAVIASYRRAARAARAELYPAGEAWRAAWTCDRRLALYGPDGLHPSVLGTYAAALVVYGRLFKAKLLSPSLTLAGVPARTGRLLQAAAATALGRRLPAGRRCGG
jgi:hypothetical protein